MKIVIFGLGNVGSAYLNYLKDQHKVFCVDPKFEKKFENGSYDLALICVETPFNEEIQGLDTSKVESCISEILENNRDIDIVIKSTVPIGFTLNLIKKYDYKRIFASPEFLRQQNALEDIKNPSRIVIGTIDPTLQGINKYMSLFGKNNFVITGLKEAEAIKLFSNAYLAMRLSFFNELDTFAELKGVNSSEVIRGLGFDPRIGDTYNTPGHGWGGSCLPKDVKELVKESSELGEFSFDEILISNERRKKYKN